jgi:hypothetical protein
MMTKSSFGFGDWASMAMQSTMLAIESQQVIALRLTKMAMGGADSQREAELMVSEKVQAMVDSGQMMFKAALGGHADMGADKVIKHYRSTVQANRKRLSQ